MVARAAAGLISPRAAAGLISLLLRTAAAQSGCETCCSSGGSCAFAYKQTPGLCCGRLDATSMCCPMNAKCFRCKNGFFRCFSASSYEP
eukprot:6314765-Prymnesium_polylepis.1